MNVFAGPEYPRVTKNIQAIRPRARLTFVLPVFSNMAQVILVKRVPRTIKP